MARFRTIEEIILSMLEFGRLTQPNANLSPGSVIRDLLIDMPAIEISKLYDQLRVSAGFQDIYSASGTELDKRARNLGYSRLQGTSASGVAVFTTNSLDANITIPLNTIITSRNGQSFRVSAETFVDSSKPNIYKSTAIRLSSDLQAAGIFDQFAVEVPVVASSVGLAGNISKYQLIRSNIAGLPTVTNTVVFSGGAGLESDSSFRSRILSVFQGSAIGTEIAYRSAIINDPRVKSVDIIGPGNLLMTRDGTVIQVDEEGTPYIVSPGSGGKVDILVQGSDIKQNLESYIYRDLSGRADPTSPLNDYVLGQREKTEDLDYYQKRNYSVSTGLFPIQPVDSLVSLSGSSSGPNFVEAYVDDFGNKLGNYELVKDDGAYAGSAFGFDKIHFISDNISLDGEQISKSQINSTDPLDFTDVISITGATQSVQISREVVSVDSTDRQYVTLNHTPFLSVDRISNATTGERYRIISQNPDGVSGEPNTTGRVQISGSTLPRSSDIVEASYNWNISYDKDIDFDNLTKESRTRVAADSIDWGFSSKIELEEGEVLYSVGDGYHILTTFPISKVINVYTYVEESVVASAGKLVLSESITDILSVKDSSGREVFYTTLSDGTVSGSVITLPSDTLLSNGSTATIIYNQVDIFSPTGEDQGTFADNKITLSEAIEPTTPVLIDYTASFFEILPNTSLSAFPALASDNEFVVGGSLVGIQPTAFSWSGDSRSQLNRLSPSYLRIVLGNLPSSGRILISGLVWEKITGVITYSNNKFDLSSLTIPVSTSCFVSNVAKAQRVELQNGEVARVLADLDLKNYELKTSLWSKDAIENASLSDTEFALSSTEQNIESLPADGEFVYVEFYVIYSAIERVSASASGEFYSSNKYAYIEELRVDSGFRNISNTISGTISVFAFNQPQTNTQYTVDYCYTAPKVGERLTISYNYNSLLTDLIRVIEPVRPIGADVLIKEKGSVDIYVEADVVPISSFTGNRSSLQNSIQQNISNYILSLSANEDLDASDVSSIITNTVGVDRVSLIKLNTTGSIGVIETIPNTSTLRFSPYSIIINLVSK